MTATVLLLALLAAPPVKRADAPRAASLEAKVVERAAHASGTQCAQCHGTSGWTDVRFDHARTGFLLEGRHEGASCKGCHPVSFTAPLPRTCSGCHQDVHAGDLGARCEGCHDTADWRVRFDVDAHRRTNFPLMGAHAGLPCTECHLEARERRFSRAAVDCAACHQKDAARTVGAAVDHAALGFDGRSCRECHGPLRFTPALFPAHDDCYPISAGPHAGISCLGCHTSLGSAVKTGTCRTGTATLCTHCHTNAGGGGGITATDAQHQHVPGYAYSPQKCAQCHAGTGRSP